jgi:hypothetical protein
MASRHAIKVRVPKVALELILAGKAPDLVPGAKDMTRDELHAAVEAIVQKDRIDLTDDTFRIKYVNYIRSYWNKR